MGTKTRPILLVSDVASGFDKIDLSRSDLEVSEPETIADIVKGIKDSGHKCIHIQNPIELYDASVTHPNCVVLSIWSGERNRNRRAIVPSICEAYRISYIGADPYAAMISGDKELSKSVCADFGIKAPLGILIRSIEQSDRAARLIPLLPARSTYRR